MDCNPSRKSVHASVTGNVPAGYHLAVVGGQIRYIEQSFLDHFKLNPSIFVASHSRSVVQFDMILDILFAVKNSNRWFPANEKDAFKYNILFKEAAHYGDMVYQLVFKNTLLTAIAI